MGVGAYDGGSSDVKRGLEIAANLDDGSRVAQKLGIKSGDSNAVKFAKLSAAFQPGSRVQLTDEDAKEVFKVLNSNSFGFGSKMGFHGGTGKKRLEQIVNKVLKEINAGTKGLESLKDASVKYTESTVVDHLGNKRFFVEITRPKKGQSRSPVADASHAARTTTRRRTGRRLRRTQPQRVRTEPATARDVSTPHRKTITAEQKASLAREGWAHQEGSGFYH